MIVPDVNLLIYAIDRDYPLHEKARAWLNKALLGAESVGFVWNVLIGFLRITTRANFPNTLTTEQAFEAMNGWLSGRILESFTPARVIRSCCVNCSRQLGPAAISYRKLTFLRLPLSTTQKCTRMTPT